MARQRHIKFTIPEPCTVPWKGMAPVGSDQRYCSSCEKVITDFSKMDDDELMLYFRHSGGKICGRYSKAQLNRPFPLLPEKTIKVKWWRTLVLIPLTFFGKELKAQYYEVVHSRNSPDTERLAVEPVLQKESVEVQTVDSVSVLSVVPPERDSLLNLIVISGTDSGMQYVWKPLKRTANINFICFANAQTQVYGRMVVIGPPPTSNYILDSLGKIKFVFHEFMSYESWLGINTLKKPNQEKRIVAQNPYRNLAEKQEKTPKPQQPALPASNDISAILPKDDRKYKRS